MSLTPGYRTYPILIPEKLVCGLSTPFELLLNIDCSSVFSFSLPDLFDLCDDFPDLLWLLAGGVVSVGCCVTTTTSVDGVAKPTMSGATALELKTMKRRFPVTLVSPSYEWREKRQS